MSNINNETAAELSMSELNAAIAASANKQIIDLIDGIRDIVAFPENQALLDEIKAKIENDPLTADFGPAAQRAGEMLMHIEFVLSDEGHTMMVMPDSVAVAQSAPGNAVNMWGEFFTHAETGEQYYTLYRNTAPDADQEVIETGPAAAAGYTDEEFADLAALGTFHAVSLLVQQPELADLVERLFAAQLELEDAEEGN